MGHLNTTDVYRKLGKKIDAAPTRAPWNNALYEILKELYTPREAEILVRMPYGLSTIEKIVEITKLDKDDITPVLERLCEKGLVFRKPKSPRVDEKICLGCGVYALSCNKWVICQGPDS